jgi:tetratricopeptide (TPR) repeat protein
MLFAVHPVQVEPVAWASGAKDLLFGLLSLCATHQYLTFARIRREQDTRSKKACVAYTCGAVMLILAMLAKPTAIVVPIVVAALDLLIVRRNVRAVAFSAGTWMLLAAPLAIVAKIVQTAAGVANTTWWQKPLLACDAVTFYLWKLVAPVNLAPDYARRPANVLQTLDGKWIYAAWLVPAAIAMLLWSKRKTHAWLAAAALCFVAVLIPVLGFVPFMFQYTSGVADHYLYLAMLGPAIALTWLLVRHNTTATKAGCGVALACFAGLSIAQGRLWKDDVTLWTHNMQVSPKSFVAPNNVAAALGRQSRIFHDLSIDAAEAGNKQLADELQRRRRDLLERAIALLDRAVANHPDYVTARHNLFVYHLRLGRVEPAVEHLEAMLRANEVAPPHMRENFTTYHDTAGLLWMRLGQWDRAQAHFEELLRRVPQHATAAKSLDFVKQKAAEARIDPTQD